jgi:hypothetical protein
LLCPPYIPELEFKSEEELHLMPQTEEEHLSYLEKEHNSTEGQPADILHNMDAKVEVSLQSEYTENKNYCQHSHYHDILKLIDLPGRLKKVVYSLQMCAGIYMGFI